MFMGPLQAPFYALQIFLAQLLHWSSSYSGFRLGATALVIYWKLRPHGDPVKVDVQWRKRG
jgi:hypothetical protein